MASQDNLRLWTAQAIDEMEIHSTSIANKLGIGNEPLPADKKRHVDTGHRQAYALQHQAAFLAAIDAALEAQKPVAPKTKKETK